MRLDGRGENYDGLKTLRNWAIGVGAAAVLSTVLLGSCFTYIPPNEFAVRKSQFGSGIEKKVYSGGYMYFTGPGITYLTFPRTTQAVNFSDDKLDKALEEEVSGFKQLPAIELSSSDGFKNQVEATILYRVTNPVVIIGDKGVGGAGRLFEDYVVAKAEPAFKQTVGKLHAEQLYDPLLRVAAQTAAKKYLNDELRSRGIEVEEVLIRKVAFTLSYEKAILAKVLQDQLLITNAELAKTAEVQAQVTRVNAEGQAAVATELQRANSEVKKKKSEADLYTRSKGAEGDLLVKTAEARGQELVNRAYEGAGSNKMVGVKMAEKAGAIKRVVITSCARNGANPLDLRQMLQSLTGGAQ